MPIDNTRPQLSMYDIEPTNQDHMLFEDLIVERNDIYGIAAEYYVLKFESEDHPPDRLYGENPMEAFDGPYLTKVNFIPVDETSVGDIFGIVNQETLADNITIPKYTFTRDVSASSYALHETVHTSGSVAQPMAGDLIHFPFSEITYEIVNVCHSQTTFLAGRFYWELNAKLYKTTQTGHIPDPDTLTNATPLSAWSDSDWIEENKTEKYTDLPNIDDLYGFK
jgi:hypothetical protein